MSNYRPIGDYIQLLNHRNTEQKASQLLGINIDKYFMPSVANVVGTDLTRYKIVERNQFACNRMHVGRDYRIPVALSDRNDPFIVSPAYDVFEIKDTNILMPEYLMMWFSRPEFDRNAWFFTDADVRGGLSWDAFCKMKLPVPSIKTQRAIVTEYNTVKNRIALNNQLIQKLEETAQAIYKKWFVDFEFPFDFTQGKPDENGKPYKSSGGKMVFNEELEKEIPEGWGVNTLRSIINYKKGNAFKSVLYQENGVRIVRVSDLTNDSIDIFSCMYIDEIVSQEFQQYNLSKNDIVITTVGSWPQNPSSVVGKVIIVPDYANGSLLNQNAVRIRTNDSKLQLFLYYSIKNNEFANYVISGAQGSANQASVTLTHIFDFKIAMPEEIGIIFDFLRYSRQLIDLKKTELLRLTDLRTLLLSKLATIEN